MNTQQSVSPKKAVVWFLTGLAIVGVVAMMAYFAKQEPSVSKNKSVTKEVSQENMSLLTVSSQDHIKGNAYAKVSLVEYSDFQCPACGAYYSMLKQVHKEYGNKIQFVYRHFPLSTIHPHAEKAARVAEAAGNQGKFWEMHDLLFENQPTWSSEDNPDQTFMTYAENLKLDIDRFKKELDSKDVRGKVAKDSSSGATLGVQGTPTFFLGGVQLDRNPQSFEEFSQLITNALASQ